METPTLKAWSVLLLYPDNITGYDTYYDHVLAFSPKDAAYEARERAIRQDGWADAPKRELPKHTIRDFVVLLIVEGHHVNHANDEEMKNETN